MNQENTSQKVDTTLQASFQQKSAGVSLGIISITAMYYLAKAWPMHAIAQAGTTNPDGFGGLVITTLGLVILAEIVLQIVLFVGAGSAPKATPAEKTAELLAKRNAYGVMVVGVMAVIGLLFAGFPAFHMANAALTALFVAEIVKFASQLIYARRNA